MKKLSIIGNITADAVIRDVNSKKVINFSVAVNEKYTDKNGQKVEKATTFFKCAIWRDNTNIAQYIRKGDKIFIEGSPEVETYQNKNGETVANIKINVREVELLGGNVKPKTETQENNNSHSETEEFLSGANNDLPF